MDQWVEITFDCLPLRTITRLDVPIDASPKYVAWCERLKSAINSHGTHNAYYLYNAHCIYRMLNSPSAGQIDFRFEGTILTDTQDLKAKDCHLDVTLASETCEWLTEPVKHWFQDSVSRAVLVEFNRYIEAGDLQKTQERIEKLQAESDDAGGFVGMYL